MNRNAWILVQTIALILIVLIPLSSARDAVAASVEAVEVTFKGDPVFGESAEPINIGNATRNQTTIFEWKRDLGSDMVNGTFYGTLWSPSEFKHSFRPSWVEVPDTLTLEGQYSYVLIASHFIFNPQTLISGASEFWVRAPFNPNCLDRNMGLQLCLFKDCSNASEIDFEHNFTTRNVIPRPALNGYMPDVLCYYEFDKNDFKAGNGRIKNGHLYLEVNAVVKPNFDYVFAFCFRMAQNSKLTTYWSDCESPAGRWTAIHYAEALQEDAENGYKNFTILDMASIEIALDLDWSFIFIEGIGAGGLFGKRMHFEPGSTLNLFPFMNTSRNGTQYLSIMWPFISNESVNASVAVYNGLGGMPGHGYHMWQFTGGDHYFQPSYCYTYNDFILFSTNDTLDWYTFNDGDRWNVWVQFTFNDETNLTMLCYEPSRPRVKWSDLDGELSLNSSINPFMRPYWTPPNEASSYEWQAFYYAIWVSARGTDGQWAYQLGTPSGAITYTYNFPQEVHLSSQYYEMVRSNEGDNQNKELTIFEQFWRTVTGDWGIDDLLFNIYNLVKGTVQYLWDGAKDLFGWIYSFLSGVYEFFKSIGEWIVTKVKEFIDMIWNFIQEAWDTIAHFWDSAKYLVAPLIMMAIVGMGARFAKTALFSTEGQG